MRLKIKLKCAKVPSVIPINYQYSLSSAIYLLLKFSSKEFSSFLHDIGYNLRGKKFKLFVFGVEFPNIQIKDNMIYLQQPEVYLYISSPLIDSFIKNFIIGTFEKQNLFINYDDCTTKFDIQQIEVIPSPEFSSQMKFKLLSPMTISTMIQKDGKLMPYYFRYDDQDLVRVLKNNLISKYKLVNKREIEAEEFEFEFDKEEIEKKHGKITKLITIAENTPQQSKVKAIQCGFRIKTNPALIKIGYECGFGEKNSMGFGMAKVINSY